MVFLAPVCSLVVEQTDCQIQNKGGAGAVIQTKTLEHSLYVICMTRLYATGYYNRERGKHSPDYVRADCVRSGIHAALSDPLRIAQIRAIVLIQLAFATLFIVSTALMLQRLSSSD
jgi:hypothetical protein